MSYFVSQEKNVHNYPNTDFMEFFKKNVNTGIYQQTSGVENYFGFVANAQSTQCVVISSGRSESVIKYAEFIYELYQNGYSVFIFDHQGQGMSSRLLPNPNIGYVNSFDDYVEDLQNVIVKVLNPLLIEHNQSTLPKTLIGHSMGGIISVLYVQKYPQEFAKMILSAPMVGIAAPLPESLTKIILKTALHVRNFLKLPASYFWGQTDYQANPFYDNRLTNSETRYRVFREMMDEYPQNKLGGISFDWLLQAIKGMSLARARAHTIILPTLIFQAEQEQIVDNNKMTQFTKNLVNAKLIIVPNAQHELLFEKNEPRTLVLTKILDFLSDSE